MFNYDIDFGGGNIYEDSAYICVESFTIPDLFEFKLGEKYRISISIDSAGTNKREYRIHSFEKSTFICYMDNIDNFRKKPDARDYILNKLV